VKYWQTALAILALLSASFARAEDFKTINGKEYKNATVSRVEPDGIVLKTKSGITKVYFTELPKEVQERFHYDSTKSAKSNVAEQAAAAQSKAEQQQQHAAWRYQDTQDPMGRYGPEHHASVTSSDGNAKLSLSWDGQTATVSLTTVNVMSSDPEYHAAIITMRMDDRPAYDYSIHIDSESFRYALIAAARPAYRPGSSGDQLNWSKFSPGDFITSLKSTHILRVEVPIHGEGSIVYTFPVEGLVW
jgi:hypothetical protein